MEFYALFKISHIIGTVLGAGGATFAEVLSYQALKDGKVTEEESGILKTTFFILRIGLFLTVVSGFGFLILWRLGNFGPEYFYDPRFLSKLLIVGMIMLNALAMQFKIIPTAIGSPISLVSWYGALILGSWRTLSVSFITIILTYTVAIVIAYYFLNYIKNKSGKTAS